MIEHPRYNRPGARGTTLVCLGDEATIYEGHLAMTGIIRSIEWSDEVSNYVIGLLDSHVRHQIDGDTPLQLVARP